MGSQEATSFANAWSPTHRVLRSARSLAAQDWQSVYQPESGLRASLARLFREGYVAGQASAGIGDREVPGGRSLSAAWLRLSGLVAECWHAATSERVSLAERVLGAFAALAGACAREAGFMMGVHRAERAPDIPAQARPETPSSSARQLQTAMRDDFR
jgi:hypothetical protein